MTVYSKGTSTFSIPNPTNASYRIYYRRRVRYATKPVAKQPAPYQLELYRTTSQPYANFMDAPNSTIAYSTPYPGDSTRGTNRAWASSLDKAKSKFKDEVYSKTSQLAANWGERKQSVDMIANRANQMRRAWRALRTGNFRQFSRELGIDPKRKDPWSRPRDAAKLWLEYWFGWSPLIGDIYNATQILQSQGPKLKAMGKATVHSPYQKLGRPINNPAWDWQYDFPDWRFRTLIQAEVQVTNKNLFRADQLGLINPASVAWELIPFSFLVDWFIPVGDFLEEFTAYAGLTFKNPFTTRSCRGSGRQWVMTWSPASSYGVSQMQGTEVRYMSRELGYPGITWPLPKAFKGFSVTRGATAISLLVTILKPGLDLPQPRNRS